MGRTIYTQQTTQLNIIFVCPYLLCIYFRHN